MANIKFTNFARSTLAIGAGSGATSLTLAAGTGVKFPTLDAGDYFYLTLENASLVREIVKVTARATDVLTVVRGQDDTSAVVWNAGDVASLRWNAKAIVDATTNVNVSQIRERHIASAGQVLFNLTTISYTPLTNNLYVYIEGVQQTQAVAYTETSPTSVTFPDGVPEGLEVVFSTNEVVDTANITSDEVHYLPAGTGAVVRDVQTKLRESVSVKDFGAIGDGVTDDTAAILAADDAGIPTVSGPSVISLGVTTATTLQNGLIGITPTAAMSDSRVDKPTIAIYSTTTRPSRSKVKSMKITGNTSDTVNDYSDLTTVSEFSHYIENHLESVGSGLNVSYGPITMGSYTGSISADPGWEDQPLRCSIGATVAFNNVKTTSWLGYEIFCANHSRVVGNGVWNSTASAQHGYRFTGYPGGPNQFNAAAANTSRLVQNGVSVQTSTRFNSLSGFTTETPTGAGLSMVVNNDKPNWHHTNNFLQGVSYQGTHGVYAAKPQYNHIQHIVDGATTFGVQFDAAGTYGANKGNLLDAVVTNSAEGASLNSSQNIVRIVASNLTTRGLVVAGSGNIIDLVVDRSGSFALQMSGSQNQLRISTTQTAATVDLSISGSSNYVQCMLGGSITVSGNDNKFVGFANLTGSTSIANSGARNNFDGIANASGMVYTAGSGAVTDASGEITVTTPTRPTMTGVSYVAIGQIFGTTLAGHTANYVGASGATGFKFRIYNAAGTALGAGTNVIMTVQYGVAINPQP